MASDEEDDDEEEEDNVMDLDAMLKKKQETQGQKMKGGRSSVSAEVYGAFNRKENF